MVSGMACRVRTNTAQIESPLFEELNVLTRLTSWRSIGCGLTLLCLLVGSVSPSGVCEAQRKSRASKKSRKKSSKNASPGAVKSIDVRIQKAQDDFIREAFEAAREYEKAGEFERAKAMFKSILKLNPDLTGAKTKIKQLDEMQLSDNLSDFTVDAGRGWSKPLVRVYKGKPIRLQAEGRFKFVTSLQVGPKGFPTENPVKGDMVVGIPAGALMGIIASPGKAGKPFLVGLGCEVAPKEDGVLYLSVNAPAGHRSSGKIKVKISGTVAKP